LQYNLSSFTTIWQHIKAFSSKSHSLQQEAVHPQAGKLKRTMLQTTSEAEMSRLAYFAIKIHTSIF